MIVYIYTNNQYYNLNIMQIINIFIVYIMNIIGFMFEWLVKMIKQN